MANEHYLFTSESVSEGHPDKICDQISDAVLDACLAKDPESHVACECFTTTGMVLVGGEISTKFKELDIQKIARDTARKIGYTDAAFGLDADSMSVVNVVHTQSPDINKGVVGSGLKEFKGQQGAGDQGMMFGFACDETPELMPAPVMFSHKILLNAAQLRHSKEIEWMRPDAKAQVTLEYEGHKPVHIDTVVLSHQHNPNVKYAQIKSDLIERVIKPVLEPTGLLDKKTKYFINPTGQFVIGGPHGDSGLTGRKIIVDTYGGMGRHGGGAFSGKDPSKVDRSAAYMARYIAKNIVAAKLATRAEVQLSYAIGVPFPVSIMVDTFGTGKIPDSKIADAVKEIFDCTPAGIVAALKLKRPIYSPTAAYGHFGKKDFSWEKTDKAAVLKNAVK